MYVCVFAYTYTYLHTSVPRLFFRRLDLLHEKYTCARIPVAAPREYE